MVVVKVTIDGLFSCMSCNSCLIVHNTLCYSIVSSLLQLDIESLVEIIERMNSNKIPTK